VLASQVVLRRMHGVRYGLRAASSAAVVTALAVWVWSEVRGLRLHAHGLDTVHAYAWPAYAATLLLIVLFLQKIWRIGASVWLSTLWRVPAHCHWPAACVLDAELAGAVEAPHSHSHSHAPQR
jgi:hypothetical protein